MAGIIIKHPDLEELRRQASELTSAVDSLAILFEEEATLLSRRKQVARLKELHSSILQEVERARQMEMAASTGHGLASLVGLLLRLGGGLITMTSKNETMQAISLQLLTGPSVREPPYGTVLVCVGLGGLPENVDVVSISSLARESKRDEREVMDWLLAHGYLLFTGDAFSRLIERLAGQILRGEVSLPVSAERLCELQESLPLRLNAAGYLPSLRA